MLSCVIRFLVFLLVSNQLIEVDSHKTVLVEVTMLRNDRVVTDSDVFSREQVEDCFERAEEIVLLLMPKLVKVQVYYSCSFHNRMREI